MPSDDSSVIGTILGHYRILKKIGAGGMGEVYRAHDQQLDRDVAIKMLPAASFADPMARSRLLREARSSAALNHPNICTIHEVGEDSGRMYIAMELVEGQCLSDALPPEGFAPDSVLRVGSQIAEALAHAHEHQVIHRDLKCANVVITSQGNVKVLDFGLAKRLTGEELNQATTHSIETATEQGTVMGTLAYMAPELLRGKAADASSDIWALGVVLFEMATGVRPFQGQTGFELSSAILNHESRPLPLRTPPALRAVIDRCLCYEPGQRYQHAGEVRAALEAIRTGTVPLRPDWHYRVASFRGPVLAVVGLAVVALLVWLNTGGLRTRLAGDSGAPRIESLAVLPFENLSGDPNQDYLASGIHEALITDLAQLSGVRKVIARSSVTRFEKNAPPLAQIAKDLNVDAIITGSVIRSGDRVQVTAHLINAATEEQLWANRYEREMKDALALEDDIVRSITTSIRLKLTPSEKAQLATARAIDPEAYEAYLKGRFQQLKQTREDFDTAERYYRFALEKDPNYALAYAGLGSLYMARSDVGFQAPAETFPIAIELLKKAVALDDTSSEAHVWLANGYNAINWDWAGTEKEFKRALELNPKDADAHFFYSDFLICTKRNEQWNEEIKLAIELDPLNEFKRSFYGWHLNYLHRYDEAIPVFKNLLTTAPNKGSNYLGLWGAYYKKNQYGEAVDAARSYFTTINEPDFANALGSGGDEVAYKAAMRRVGEMMVAESTHRHMPSIRIARMFSHAGDSDTAMQWLEKAYKEREGPMIRIAVFWDWDNLRSDPRFNDLLHRMNLPL